MPKVYTLSGYYPDHCEVIPMIPEKDAAIVSNLRKNGRMKLTELSRRTGLPVSTLFDRVRFLNELGIKRISALLDFPLLGFGTCATIFFKVISGKKDDLKEHLLCSSSVNSLMRVNNGYDFMAECVFKDMRGLEEFCENAEQFHGVRGKEVHFVIEELKREGFLPEVVKHGHR
jgi:DNA-binding Lrp family transcriptional regulator